VGLEGIEGREWKGNMKEKGRKEREGQKVVKAACPLNQNYGDATV
jgi:hypothetical protein